MSNTKPIYLFTGPEFGLRDDAINEIKKIQKKIMVKKDFRFLA